MKKSIKEISLAFIICIFVFQPANDSSSQVSTKKETVQPAKKANEDLKKRVDEKAIHALEDIKDLKEQSEKRSVKIRWKVKTKIVYDTVWMSSPKDTSEYKYQEQDTIHDTIIIPQKGLIRKLFGK